MFSMRKVLVPVVGAVLLTACQDAPIGPSGPVVLAAVTVDAETGTGFVGKGEVQIAFGWNNKQLQQNQLLVQFRISSETVTEVSWVCTNSNNDKTQERERTTTSSVQGVLSGIARDGKKQFTGFNILGYDGDPVIGAPTTDGPTPNSCPDGPWTLTTPAGDPQVVSSTGGVEASIDGVDWVALIPQG